MYEIVLRSVYTGDIYGDFRSDFFRRRKLHNIAVKFEYIQIFEKFAARIPLRPAISFFRQLILRRSPLISKLLFNHATQVLA